MAEISTIEKDILNAQDDIIISVNKDGIITFANTSFLEKYKLVVGGELMVGNNLFSLPTVIDHIEHNKMLERFKNALAGQTIKETIQVDINDKLHYFDAMYYPVSRNGEIQGAFKIGKNTTELVETITMLENSLKENDEQISRIGHEFKNTLNAIVGYSQLINSTMKEKMLYDKNPELKSHLDIILNSSSHLQKLVNDIISITTANTGNMKLSLEPVNVESVITEIMNENRTFSDEKDIQVELFPEDDDIFIFVDKTRFRQIISNIINNAIKFNKPKGKILICIMAHTATKTVDITIEDTGIGIKNNKLSKLFKPFERLGMENTDITGTGIGLSYAHTLTKYMDGNISVSSTWGKGTKFIITFPITSKKFLKLSGSDPLPILNTQVHYKEPKNILYIEDSSTNYTTVNKILNKARPDITVIRAKDAKEGLQKIKKDYDAILIDLYLSDLNMSGLDIIKQNKNLVDKIIVISADVSEIQKTRIYKAGIKNFISKPISVKKLLLTIDRIINQKKLEASNNDNYDYNKCKKLEEE